MTLKLAASHLENAILLVFTLLSCSGFDERCHGKNVSNKFGAREVCMALHFRSIIKNTINSHEKNKSLRITFL